MPKKNNALKPEDLGRLDYYPSPFKIEGSYNEFHTPEECDKCGKNVGLVKLKPLPYLLLMKNDKVHPDVTRYVINGRGDLGYRQYWVCTFCLDNY